MKKQQGFTLLEILIALVVFSILATITSSAMYHAFNTRTLVTKQADRLSSIQLAMALIQRDTQQIIARSVRSNASHPLPMFLGQPQELEFTRGGGINTDSNILRSTLMRVALLCRNGTLVRRSWPALDTPHRTTYQDKVLLNNLTECKFAYLTHNQQLLSTWRENALKQNQHKELLPSAIQLTLSLKDWGNMSLLFVIPEALYAE